MSPTEMAEVLATLERTPAVLRTMLAGLPDPLLRATEGDDSWSPFDVLGHLVHGEKTDWIPRLRRILSDGEARPFEPFDRFAQLESSRGASAPDLLDEFGRLRAESLAELRALLEGGLDLAATGTHPELGRVTAAELLATWAAHDLGHMAQVARVMARHFGPDTGPWKAYLPILG